MYGRETQLTKLNEDRNNPKFGPFTRLQADKAHRKITSQLKDKKLMGMRERLIRATIAGDSYESSKIQMMMRDYTRQDQETGE